YSEKASIIPPLDVPYLAGYLDAKQVSLEIMEAEGQHLTREAVAQRIGAIRPPGDEGRILAAVRTAAPTLDWDLSVCVAMKEANPSLRVAIYGPVVPHVLKRLCQENWLDY